MQHQSLADAEAKCIWQQRRKQLPRKRENAQSKSVQINNDMNAWLTESFIQRLPPQHLTNYSYRQTTDIYGRTIFIHSQTMF